MQVEYADGPRRRFLFAWRVADPALGDTHTLYEVRSADAMPLWVAP